MRRLAPVLVLCLVFPAAAEVYRWTDADGRVYYGERPPPQGAQKMDLPDASPAPGAGDPDAAARRSRQQRLLEAYEYERAQRQSEAARAERERQADAGRCRALQQRWRRLSYSGPVYIGRADGGRDYLDEAQRAAEKAGMRPAYLQACGREP